MDREQEEDVLRVTAQYIAELQAGHQPRSAITWFAIRNMLMLSASLSPIIMPSRRVCRKSC